MNESLLKLILIIVAIVFIVLFILLIAVIVEKKYRHLNDTNHNMSKVHPTS